jgi:hypothetical protein
LRGHQADDLERCHVQIQGIALRWHSSSTAPSSHSRLCLCRAAIQESPDFIGSSTHFLPGATRWEVLLHNAQWVAGPHRRKTGAGRASGGCRSCDESDTMIVKPYCQKAINMAIIRQCRLSSANSMWTSVKHSRVACADSGHCAALASCSTAPFWHSALCLCRTAIRKTREIVGLQTRFLPGATRWGVLLHNAQWMAGPTSAKGRRRKRLLPAVDSVFGQESEYTARARNIRIPTQLCAILHREFF